MKNLFIISIFLFFLSDFGKAQDSNGFGCYTDKDVYVSGEALLAKIYTPNENPSRIIYLDLINQSGMRITGASLEIVNSQADGYLQLPDSLSSGTYMVRAYMKNTAERIKIVREIWVTNRFDGLEKINQIKRAIVVDGNPERMTGEIEIDGIQPEYSVNQPFEAIVKTEEVLRNKLDGNLLVCVARTDSLFKSKTFEMQSVKAMYGMTEQKGIVLSGTVYDKKTDAVVSGVTVFLTIPDSIPGFQYYKTKSDGRFYFLLKNYFGSVHAFVQCFSSTPTQKLKIKMDDLFAEPGIFPELSQHPILAEFRNAVTQDVDAITFQKIFNQEKLRFSPVLKQKVNDYPYYGMPTNTVMPGLFIDLPNFTEISREILPGVKFRNYNNEPSMVLMNITMLKYFEDMPLLLIDGIPVRDLNTIKELGTKDIEKIDICQNERFYGDLRFAGVVSISTTHKDFSLIRESDQLIRLDIDAIQVKAGLNEPVEEGPSVPDIRQDLYWNPSTKPAESFSVKCHTSSVKGQYKMIIRGKLKDGTLIFSEKQFEVK